MWQQSPVELSHGSRCSTRGGSEPGTICAKRFHIIVMVVIMAHFDQNRFRTVIMMVMRLEIEMMKAMKHTTISQRGQRTFLEQKCQVPYCEVFGNRETADVVLYKNSGPQHRVDISPNQIWILYLLESPYHTPKFPPQGKKGMKICMTANTGLTLA